jgi:hypothetical protein
MSHLKVKKSVLLGFLSILFVLKAPAENNPLNLTDEEYKDLALHVVNLPSYYGLYDPNSSLIESIITRTIDGADNVLWLFEGQSDLRNSYTESLTESYERSTVLTESEFESYNQKRQIQAQEINLFLEDFTLTTGNPFTYINGWFYIPKRGWHFTNTQTFPFIYEPISKEWLLLVSKTKGLFSSWNSYELETLIKKEGLQPDLFELTNEKATFLIAPKAQLLISANHNIYRSLSMLKSSPIASGIQEKPCLPPSNPPLIEFEGLLIPDLSRGWDCPLAVILESVDYPPNREDLFFNDYFMLLTRTADPSTDYSLELSSRFKLSAGGFTKGWTDIPDSILEDERHFLFNKLRFLADEKLLAEVQKILDDPHEYGFKYILESMPDLLEQCRELGLKEGAEILPDVIMNYPVVTAAELKEEIGNDYTDCSYTEGWYYQSTKGWRWTSDKVFPFIYKNDSQAWLYFNTETGDFYDYDLGIWYTE